MQIKLVIRIILVLTIGWALFISPFAKANEKPESIFSTFPQAQKKHNYFRHYDQYKLITGKNQKHFETKVIEGQLLRQYFEIPNTFSERNILDNFIQQIEQHHGQILYQCHDETECGEGEKVQTIIRPLENIGDNRPHLVTAKFQSGSRNTWVSIYVFSCCRRSKLQVDQLIETDEPLDLVKLDSSVLSKPATQIKFKDLSKKDKKGAHDHPLLTRLPGSYINSYKSSGYERNKLVNGRNKNGSYQHIQIKGKTTYIGYWLPRTYSELEVIENYRAALSKAQFVEQYSCESKHCGDQDRMSDEVGALETIGNDESQRYLLAKLDRPEGEIWVSVYVTGYINGLWTNVHIVESNELIKDRIAVDADAIQKAIETTGHIALDGILFKFDSDQLEAASFDVLKEVASYIKTVPNYQFYVVGHTDDKGDASYNKVLADQRAAKVTSLLITKYKIPKNQLVAQGIGEYSPKASNASEQGRQLNRRVELVLRSDSK